MVATEARGPEVRVAHDKQGSALRVTLRNAGPTPCVFRLTPMAYGEAAASRFEVAPMAEQQVVLSVATSQGWYDFSATLEAQPAYSRRFAGRLETGAPSISDPEMHGLAIGEQYRRA
jgi:phospholipase C